MNTNQMGMHVVLVGNPVDGITIYGPFKTWPDAAVWSEEFFGHEEVWWLAPLQAPEGRCAALDKE